MNLAQTMVFVDLAGSTTAFAVMGNAQVAEVVTKVTQWIDRVVGAHGGRTVKFLGDGVLAQFDDSGQAIEAAVFLQQNHTERLRKWPEALRMGLKIGLATGSVVEMAGDAFGDAVNLSSRLSDMAGEHGIWASESVISNISTSGATRGHANVDGQQSVSLDSVRYRSLGVVPVRGLAQPHSVFQIEWSEDVTTDLMTVQGALQSGPPCRADGDRPRCEIALAWLGHTGVFPLSEGPITIGRVPDCDFVVGDQRVSRVHARIEQVAGAIVVVDMSSFGTWVRFAENPATDIALRRDQCVLYDTGEISLGAGFDDFSAPVAAFRVTLPARSLPNRVGQTRAGQILARS
ncbi:adenylate/guanylate cyclase domain-containing protein [Ottowia sp. GY511]|uniref:Adenylate/guanylate cyclase domain-containing protein n=1 Tax=Ottowia flava TaxID=2675430 RepID=A0ABW4KN38_9BURK|nr:adenylate/guanylate cyclase domain-containing protein [Ottowia sp. GY511]TXK29626.1 adenylate/guanylate cyclase domain-containing protein [Ottowia sp. GY511]